MCCVLVARSSCALRALSSFPLHHHHPLLAPSLCIVLQPKLPPSPSRTPTLFISRCPSLPPISFFRSGAAFLNEVGDHVLPFADAFDSPDDEDEEQDVVDLPPPRPQTRTSRFPLLTNKEKKELRAYANGLGKKLVLQQVGKAGVTASLTQAISDTLEANEIVKLRVLDNCPEELEEVTRKIEGATDAQLVGKIGSVLLLYRPSLRKLAAAEKQKNKPLQSRTGRTTKFGRGGRRT